MGFSVDIGGMTWEHVKWLTCVTLTANAWDLAALWDIPLSFKIISRALVISFPVILPTARGLYETGLAEAATRVNRRDSQKRWLHGRDVQKHLIKDYITVWYYAANLSLHTSTHIQAPWCLVSGVLHGQFLTTRISFPTGLWEASPQRFPLVKPSHLKGPARRANLLMFAKTHTSSSSSGSILVVLYSSGLYIRV